MGVAWRGRSGHGDGVHVLTGPVWVCGAEPGDVLQVGHVASPAACVLSGQYSSKLWDVPDNALLQGCLGAFLYCGLAGLAVTAIQGQWRNSDEAPTLL